ncbi:MAG: hypothetical protein IIY07_00065, partial [Thermoguttaceae bacterium]|nr:hypothetical protein [Thermoguttaceae bacterium]
MGVIGEKRKPARSRGEKLGVRGAASGRRLATTRRYRPLYAFFEKRQEDGGGSNGVPERKKRLKTCRLSKMVKMGNADAVGNVSRSG